MAATKKTRQPARRRPVKKTAARRRTARPARERRKDPQTLRLRSAGPSLTVNDLERSLVWYRDVLGFTLGERWEREGKLAGAELVAGKVSFWLSQDDWQKGRDRIKGEGFRIYCDTVQDVDALARAIKARGGRLLEEPRDQPYGARDFAVVDPDGFKITISQEK